MCTKSMIIYYLYVYVWNILEFLCYSPKITPNKLSG